MDLLTILTNSVWAGLQSFGVGILFTAPLRYIPPIFLCGFMGRFVRDLFMSWGISQNWSTAVASALLVLVAVAVVRRHSAPPVVLISGVMPLGTVTAVIKAILELMRISSLEGEALNASSVALSSNIGKAFTTTLAIALGFAAGMTIVRLFKWQKDMEEV